LPFLTREIVAQQLLQRRNAITIDGTERMRQLALMPTALHRQSMRDQRNRMVNADPQPKIIIFTHRQILIKPAKSVEKVACHHDGRWADQAKLKAAAKDIPRRFLMLKLWIDPAAATNPDLIGLANLNFWMLLHKSDLHAKFLRKPEIVGIEKRKIWASGYGHSPVSG
jgi:hypothetical protein